MDRNTRPLSSAHALRRRRQPVPSENNPGLLKSESDVEEIPDELPEVPKKSDRQRIISIYRYYTNVLNSPPQRDWKGQGSTIWIIR